MNQKYYILIFFALLFLIERKAINILIAFIGMLLTIAFIIPDFGLSIVKGEYISYILILVQVSALTILFGYILMLFPTLSQDTYSNSSKKTRPLFISLFFLLSIILINFFFPWVCFEYPFSDTNILLKMGQIFYTEEEYIIKLILITIILFLAIVALFFMLGNPL